jgi:hypothetical protein
MIDGPNGADRVVDGMAACLGKMFKALKPPLTAKEEAALLEQTVVPPGHAAMTWIKAVRVYMSVYVVFAWCVAIYLIGACIYLNDVWCGEVKHESLQFLLFSNDC